jgi:hypothetical protein
MWPRSRPTCPTLAVQLFSSRQKSDPGMSAGAVYFNFRPVPSLALRVVVRCRSDRRRGIYRCRCRRCRRRIGRCRRRHLRRCWRPRLIGCDIGSVLPGLVPHAEHNREDNRHKYRGSDPPPGRIAGPHIRIVCGITLERVLWVAIVIVRHDGSPSIDCADYQPDRRWARSASLPEYRPRYTGMTTELVMELWRCSIAQIRLLWP